MGVVYKAEDITLGRFVALKFLPEELTSNPGALERFLREARAASALNHPHICTVHEIHDHEGQPFIVMEFIEGETLAHRIAAKSLRLDTVLDVSIQVADALDAAHSNGIVHRDIKPGNIIINSRDQVKVLDFGLAKLTPFKVKGSPAPHSSSSSRQPLDLGGADGPLTSSGMAIGTLGYMSPEQVRGEELDARSDLFSLGAVMYEMATGRAAFLNQSYASRREAPLVSPIFLNPEIPPHLDDIIKRALELDRGLRYQTASDLHADLQRVKRDTGSRQALPAAAKADSGTARVSWQWAKRPRVPVVLGLLLLALLISSVRNRPVPAVRSYVAITNDGHAKFPTLGSQDAFKFPRLVTDGTRLYFLELSKNTWVLMEVSAAGGETAPVSNSLPGNPVICDISPDRSQLMVVTYLSTEAEAPLWVLPVPAGTPRRLGSLVGHDGTWSLDGRQIVFANGRDLLVASAAELEPRKLVTAPGTPFWPRWSPDGRRLRYTVFEPNSNSGSLWEANADGSNPHQLIPGWNDPAAEGSGSWTPDGRFYIFHSARNGRMDLWALREKALLSGAVGDPVGLTAGPLSFGAPVPGFDGRRIFAIGSQARGELVRYDTASQQFVPFAGGISADGADFSTDGKWMTYVSVPDGTLWRSRVDGTERVQLTLAPTIATLPRWSPDGQKIAFMAEEPGKPWQIRVVPAPGGNVEPLYPESLGQADPTWAPDGSALVFGRSSQVGGQPLSQKETSIYRYNFRSRKAEEIPGSQGLYSPRYSPDGRFILALPVDSSKLVLLDTRTGKWSELASAFVGFPSWSHDSKYIYFDNLQGEAAFNRIRIEDHKLEQVASLAGLRRVWGSFGPWSGLAPNDSPLVLRDIGTQEIYALDWEAP